MNPTEPPPGWDPAAGLEGLGGGGLMPALERWTAEARVADAADARRRERSLRRQAEESTTFAGVLADLAERQRPVVLATSGGRRHRGVLRVLGADFVALITDVGAEVLVARWAITSVRSGPRESAAASGRVLDLDLRLHEALAALAEDRPRVQLVTRGDEHLSGDLRNVGLDVVTVRVDGDTLANVYVPIATIAEISTV